MNDLLKRPSTSGLRISAYLLGCACFIGLPGCGGGSAKPGPSSQGGGPVILAPAATSSEAEEAIAILEIEQQSGLHIFQHAVCVDPSGLFISVDRFPVAIEQAKSLRLHLSPSKKEGESVPADCVNCRVGYVFCVQARGTGNYPYAKMADPRGLPNQTEVEALNVKFRPDRFLRADYVKPTRAKDTIRQNNGRETVGERIELMKGAGYGLPVFNSQGEVIALGSSGVGSLMPIECASVRLIREWLATPKIALVRTPYAPEELSKPKSIDVKVGGEPHLRPQSTVELEVLDANRPPQKFQAKAQGNMQFANVTLRPVGDGSLQQIRAEFDGAIVEGAAPDTKLGIGDRELRLSELERFDALGSFARLKSGEEIKGALRKGDKIEVSLGDVKTPIALDSLVRLETTALDPPVPSIRYRLRLITDGKMAAEATGEFDIRAEANTAGQLSAATSANATSTDFAPELKVPIAKEKLRDVYPLPSVIGRVTPAGKGRYLLLHFPMLRMISFFDVAKQEIARSIPAGGDDLLLLGSSDQAVVVDHVNAEIRTFDLETGRLRNRAAIPKTLTIKEAQVGICSPGPALAIVNIGQKYEFGLLDLQSLQVTAPIKPKIEPSEWPFLERGLLRASADGKSYAYSNHDRTFDKVTLISLPGDNTLNLKTSHKGLGKTISFQGSRVFGLWGRTDFQRHPAFQQMPTSNDQPPWEYWIRTYHPSFFLQLTNSPKASVVMKTLNEMADVSKLPIPASLYDSTPENPYHTYAQSNLLIDERLHFYPDMNLLISIPATSDEIRMEEVDWRAPYRTAQSPYLIVTSMPPATTRRGETYRYQIKTMAPTDQLTYSMYFGDFAGGATPITSIPGVQVSPTGEFTWEVPANASMDAPNGFMIAITPSGGPTVHYSFSVEVTE